MPSIHTNPKPGSDSGYEGGGSSWDDPNGPVAVLQKFGLLPERYEDAISTVKDKARSAGAGSVTASAEVNGIAEMGAGEGVGSETGADLAKRATDGLRDNPGLLEEIEANTASAVDVIIWPAKPPRSRTIRN
jgi:hypothetical protein